MARNSHSKAGVLRPEGVRGAEAAFADEQKDLIELVLRALSERDREVLLRFYVREQHPDQICTEMEISETQLRLIKSRAKAKIAKFIQNATPRRRGPGKAVVTRPQSDAATINLDRAIPVMAHAVAVFGDEKKASHWFNTPLAILENRSPTELLADGDVQSVDTLLTRIEHNIPS